MSNLQIVIFALVKNGKILMEKRPVRNFKEDIYLIPGGAINPDEKLEDALKREMMEELKVSPTDFELLTDKQIIGLFDNDLKPFIIKSWQGEIPKINHDPDDKFPLEWIDLEEVDTPVESVQQIIQMIKDYDSD